VTYVALFLAQRVQNIAITAPQGHIYAKFCVPFSSRKNCLVGSTFVANS